MPSSTDTIQRILPLLEEAEQIASGYSGGHSRRFKSAEALQKALHIAILQLKFRDTSEVPAMKKWFAPGSDWDSIIGPQGNSIRRQIYELLPEIHLTHLSPQVQRRHRIWNWVYVIIQVLLEAL